jgi:hypothetical protein
MHSISSIFVSIALLIALVNIVPLLSVVVAQIPPEDSSFVDSDNLLLSNFSGLDDFAGSGSMDQLSNMPFDLKGIENLVLGKSLLGAIGISMVDNVSISGIQLINESTLSVNLDHSTGNGNSPLVSIFAYKIPLNNSDIGALISSMSNSSLMNTAQNENNFYSTDTFPNQPNPLSILEKIQIGSSSLTNASWTSPHTLTMKLIKTTHDLTNFDFVVVTALPYTGTEM